MIRLHLHFLTGRYAATAYNDRERPEWPPHPARVFSALVDALHAESPVDAAEAAVLDVLAAWPAPRIDASEAHPRRVMVHYVPVNDQAVTDSKSVDNWTEKVADARRVLAALPSDAPTKERRKAERTLEKHEGKRQEAAARAASVPSRFPNDNPAERAMPWGRTKQPRTFPVVLPVSPTAAFTWPQTHLSDNELAALQRVASRVHRLGHSSSFVHLHVERADAEEPVGDEERRAWVPDDHGEVSLRVPQEGQREALEGGFARHQGDLPGRVMPARHVRYAVQRPGEPVADSQRARGAWVVYRLVGADQPGAAAARHLAEGVRAALLSHAPEPIHPQLSGHDGERVLKADHLAVIPLPFAGFDHGDGTLKGFALSLPADAPEGARQALYETLGRWEQFHGGGSTRTIGFRHGGVTREATRVLDDAASLRTLQRARWAGLSGPTRRWATVTPIALDGGCPPFHHPTGSIRRKARKVATKLVRRAAVRALQRAHGVDVDPSEVGVALVFDAPVRGAASLRDVSPYQRAGHGRPRRLVHAIVDYPIPVRGPLVLGAGRHFGLGLCAPLPELQEVADDAP